MSDRNGCGHSIYDMTDDGGCLVCLREASTKAARALVGLQHATRLSDLCHEEIEAARVRGDEALAALAAQGISP